MYVLHFKITPLQLPFLFDLDCIPFFLAHGSDGRHAQRLCPWRTLTIGREPGELWLGASTDE